MRPFILTLLITFIASTQANGYGSPQQSYGSSQSPPLTLPYQQSSSAPSYGQQQRSAPVETVRVSYSSNDMGSNYGSSSESYSAPQVRQESYGSQSAPSYGGQQQRSAPVETVRVSFADSGSSYQQSSPSNSYSAPPVVRQESYSAPAVRQEQSYSSYTPQVRSAPPVETVRVSYSSGSEVRSGGGYGGGSSSPSYGGQSSPSYGGQSSQRSVPILRHNQEITAGNSHSFDFQTGDGISHSEQTSVRGGGSSRSSSGYGQSSSSYGGQSDEPTAEVTKVGSYSYTSPEGQRISLSYQADKDGYRAQGDHLPTPPPIPQEIAASLRSLPTRSNGY